MPKHTLHIGSIARLGQMLFEPIFKARKRYQSEQKNHRRQTLVRAIASH
jgi:hypothetical protein